MRKQQKIWSALLNNSTQFKMNYINSPDKRVTKSYTAKKKKKNSLIIGIAFVFSFGIAVVLLMTKSPFL